MTHAPAESGTIDAMYARVSTVRNNGTAAEREHRLAVARELFPAVVQQAGCLGGLVLDDPTAGILRVIVLWETAEAMIRARDDGKAFRERFARELDIRVEEIDVSLADVVEFDVTRAMAT